ncbi:MAG: flippase-like domain-containing protein, partial [Rickettsiales bacterium]|nr:flippase-like domain-containing protein [Rickettsiales bacterium]
YSLERLLAPFARFRLVGWTLHFLSHVKLILTHRFVSVASLSLAVVAHICYSVSAFVMAQSLGIPMTVMQSMAFIPLIMLVTTIPISIGGWGLREASMVGLLGLVGIQAEAALMLSIQLALLFMFISLPAGVIWMLDRKTARVPHE